MFSHIAAAFVILLSLGAGRFTSEPSSEDKIVTLELRPVGNELEFEQKEIRARAGQKIRVVFTNTSSVMPTTWSSSTPPRLSTAWAWRP